MNFFSKPLTGNQLRIFEILIIVGLSIFPMLFSLPFRIHLDLPWEGAYRMYIGQMPFRDFKMPLGYGYLVILWVFFKIFGPYLFSLIYAQVFINLVAAFTFRAILKLLNVSPVNILFSVFVFCVSYNFIYFWPWYNQTALMFELVGLYFLLIAIFKEKSGWKHLFCLFLAALFAFMAFFTKQDYGGLSFMFFGVIILYNSILEKKWLDLIWYGGFFGLVALVIIFPLLPHEFGYWFNYGQPPHEKRVVLYGILDEFFSANSAWEKFYILAALVIILNSISDFKSYFQDKTKVIFALITLGIIAEALITKVTSKHSSDNTTYFHGFAVAFILANLNFKFDLAKVPNLLIVLVLVFVWWSAMYWKYAGRILTSLAPKPEISEVVADSVKREPAKWVLSNYRSFKRITLPEQTIAGVDKIKNLSVVKNKKDLKVLNLTEMTMLAYEIPYVPQKGLPLWYHNKIGIFPKQIDEICGKIERQEYDIILYEEIASLREFFAPALQECAKKHYKQTDRFLAPRKEEDSYIEVYVKE